MASHGQRLARIVATAGFVCCCTLLLGVALVPPVAAHYRPVTCADIDFEVETLRPVSDAAGTVGLSIEQVRRHINARPLYFVDAHEAAMTCVDGRDDQHVIASPGGDTAEFLNALSTYRSLGGTRGGDRADVERVLTEYLATTPHTRWFYMHSDTESLANLWLAAHAVATPDGAERIADADRAEVTREIEHRERERRAVAEDERAELEYQTATIQPLRHAPELDIHSPPESMRADLLLNAVHPRNVGCGHLRQFLLRADEYHTPLWLTGAVIESVFTYMWRTRSPGVAPTTHDRIIEYDILTGEHHETAVLIVHTDVEAGPCAKSNGFFPAIYPNVQNATDLVDTDGDGEPDAAPVSSLVFVYHQAAAYHRRSELARFFATQPFSASVSSRSSASVRSQLLHQIDANARHQLNLTLATLAPHLPYYSVRFMNTGDGGAHGAGGAGVWSLALTFGAVLLIVAAASLLLYLCWANSSGRLRSPVGVTNSHPSVSYGSLAADQEL